MAANTRSWICTVCSYVHTGAEPPDCCMVCGATSDLFESHQEPVHTTMLPFRWRCLNCDYVETGPQPPGVCPVCGAPAERFESRAPEAATHAVTSGSRQTVAIVGAGIAGVSAAESVRNASPEAQIVLVSA